MNLLPDPEQREIIDTTAAFLAAELPLSRLHESHAPVPVSPALARQMAELGWFGLGLPEEAGGIGFSLAEEALVFRELGRVLAPSNILAGVLAARVAVHGGDRALAAAIIAGEKRVALADALDGAEVGAHVSGGFHCIDGSDVELALCASSEGFAIVERAALGNGKTEPCIDEHTHLARIEASGVAALCAAGESDDQLRNRGAVLAAAMLAGIAEAVRDQAAAYACERKQFGKPIGVFQAIKHKCADMATRAETATWQTFYAALSVRAGSPDASLQASAAKGLAADAAAENAHHNVLVHGGYGVTDEYDPHLFLKRAHVLDRVLGTHDEHFVRVLAQPAAA